MTVQTHTTHTLPIRIYYEDTDAGGVVYYANYLKFFERARTEYLRQMGIDQFDLLQQHNIAFVVSKTQLSYKSPARLDDLVHIQTRVIKQGGASIQFEQICEKDGQTLVHCMITICCVFADTFKVRALPDFLQALST